MNPRRVARVGLLAGVALGCVPALGGWDLAALLEAEPAVASIEGQRIGDLTPYPALADDRVLLVACRYPSGAPILVSGVGEGWRRERAAFAVRAVARELPGAQLALAGDRSEGASGPASIEVVSVDDPNAVEPAGLGDTLAECDVTREGTDPLAIRGRLVRSQIRLRSDLRANAWRGDPIRDEEWVGALMHELGHALGFAGHPGFGDSILLLEEGRLRAFGRRAIAGERVPAPNLAALYSLAPGRVLGEVEVTHSGRELIRAVLARVAEREARLGPGSGPLASSGDRAARIRWLWPGEHPLELRFPFWRQQVGRGQPISVVSNESTDRAPAPPR